MTKLKTTISYGIFKEFVQKNSTIITNALDLFFKGVRNGASDTKKTSLIIQDYIVNGEIDKQNEKFLKFYVLDMLKIAGIGIPFVLLPGASVIIPFILKAAEKRNIDLIPSNFKKTSTSTKVILKNKLNL